MPNGLPNGLPNDLPSDEQAADLVHGEGPCDEVSGDEVTQGSSATSAKQCWVIDRISGDQRPLGKDDHGDLAAAEANARAVERIREILPHALGCAVSGMEAAVMSVVIEAMAALPDPAPKDPGQETTEIEDGFGGYWSTCGQGCDLQVVRPGKVQCNQQSASCPDARPTEVRAAYRAGDVADVDGRRAIYMPHRWEWLDGTWTAIPEKVGPVLGNIYDLPGPDQSSDGQGHSWAQGSPCRFKNPMGCPATPPSAAHSPSA